MKTNFNRGIATIELLIALAVGVIMLSGVAMLAFGSQTMRLDTELVEHGLYKTFSITEDTSADVAANWDDADETSETDSIYTKVTAISDISPCIKLVGGDVDWTSEKNRDFSLGLETLVAGITQAKAMGGGCDPFPPSGWDTPDIKGGKDVTPGGQVGTSIKVRSINGTRYAFITTRHTSAASDDLWIYDTTDPANPTYVRSLNTGKGLNDIEVVKTGSSYYAYAMQNDKTNQLQVINVTNPTSASLTTSISLDAYNVDPTGTDPEGRVNYYYDGKLYVGLKTTMGPELLVFNVESNPANPSFVGAINSGFNHTINDLVVIGNYAYLATSNDNRELMIIDVSGSTPTDTGQGYNANLSANDNEDAVSLFVSGQKLYMGRQRTNQTAEREFYIFSITNPTSPTVLGSKRFSLNPNTQVSSIAVQGPYAFVGTSDSNGEFQLWQIDDPSNIHQPSMTSCSTFNFPQEVSAIEYADDYVFTSVKSNEAFRIVYDTPATCTP